MRRITTAVACLLVVAVWMHAEAANIPEVTIPTDEDIKDAILKGHELVETRLFEQMQSGGRSKGRRFRKSTTASRAIRSEAALLKESVRVLTENHPHVKRSAAHGLILDFAQRHERDLALNNSTILAESPERNLSLLKEKFPLGPGKHLHKPGVQVHFKPGGFPRKNFQLPLFPTCYPPGGVCDKGCRYRELDGTCNNLKYKHWGSANIKMRRLPNLNPPTAYADFFNSPRGGNPSSLPNPRFVSTTVHPDVRLPAGVTNMVQQFGQFVDHDITLTPEEEHECCEDPSVDQDCFPISIPSNDSFYSSLTTPQTCLEFTRSTAFCTGPGDDHREQMNAITAFLDASQVYGSDKTLNTQLRTNVNGLLNVTEVTYTEGGVSGVRHLLPQTSTGFLAGDIRVNEMPGLITMHTLFLREHNRIAREIKAKRPEWNDEKIFQESRRILIAEFQNVVYSEYLPIVLGEKAMKDYNLHLGWGYSVYDPTLDPSIFNSFATAAYRFGHSMIVSLVKLFFGSQNQGSFLLRNNYFNTNPVTADDALGMEYILEGLTKQPAETFDRFLVKDVNDLLFQDIAQGFGSDLTARNIQRGRDHGLPGLLAFRKACGLSTNPSSGVNGEMLDVYESTVLPLYSSPADVDLFTGGLVEKPVPGALTGPTFNCIKAEQFRRLKFGDRFFFTHWNNVGFNWGQLKALRRRTLRDIICDNVDPRVIIPKNVFKVPQTEPTITCSVRQSLDINLFVKKTWFWFPWVW